MIKKDLQTEYQAMMRMSAGKRTSDSKILTEKESTKASIEGDLEIHEDEKTAATKQLGATLKYIASLHAKCD